MRSGFLNDGSLILMNLGKEFRGFGRYMTLGIQMVVVTAVIALIGYWLDRKTGNTPLFLIIFFVLGSFGGMAFVWREMKSDNGRKQD